MNFNLNALALDPTTIVELKHPTEDFKLTVTVTNEAGESVEQPVAVEVYGKASKQYRNAQNAFMNKVLRRQQRKEKPDAETLNDDQLTMLTECIKGVKNLEVDGVEPKTKEQFRALLGAPEYSWLRAQVDEAIGNDANFLAQ